MLGRQHPGPRHRVIESKGTPLLARVWSTLSKRQFALHPMCISNEDAGSACREGPQPHGGRVAGRLRLPFPETCETPQSPSTSIPCFVAAAPSDVDQNCSGPPLSLTQGDHWVPMYDSSRTVAELNGEVRLAAYPLVLMQETNLHDVACTIEYRALPSDTPNFRLFMSSGSCDLM
jgi:hypothetical protein